MVIHSGIVPMCPASQPTVPDFSCGFQFHFSSGTRSRALRVFCISLSNSPNIDLPILIKISQEFLFANRGILGEQKANCQENFVADPTAKYPYTFTSLSGALNKKGKPSI